MGGDLRGYAICAEQRTGSSYLCQILMSTGVLGRPIEYFNGLGLLPIVPNYPQDAEGQLREVTRLGATPNGVYGLKLFSDDFDRIAGTRWTRRLPNLRFVSLTRRDLLGQAISAVRMAQTGQYASLVEADREPVYEPAQIVAEIHRLAWGKARWEAFFARCGLAPLHLEYEEIAARPQKAADSVASLVGLDGPATVDLRQVVTRVQRDSISDEWRARFVAEAQDPAFLDKPLPAPLPPSLRTRLKRQLQRWIRRQPA